MRPYAIYESVMGHGDFTRYILRSDAGRLDWLDRPLEMDSPSHSSASLAERHKLGSARQHCPTVDSQASTRSWLD